MLGASSPSPCLSFDVIAKCSVSRARASRLFLKHGLVDTPVFMPVGTQGTLKGITSQQLLNSECQILLGNTYHLGHRPGPEIMETAGGLHKMMNWPNCLLTDSGGFQMVSLLKLTKLTEEGVKFNSPHDGSLMLLSPEHSMSLQNSIGADIIMQLDDVVATTCPDSARMQEAMGRSVRWLDRCIAAHKRPEDQALFCIIQGGLDLELRTKCMNEMVRRNTPGIAIGGLSGGEDKNSFWRVVKHCSDQLHSLGKPLYCMGVGYAIDLVVCTALGIDMFDCVFPTRTARFGNALIRAYPGKHSLGNAVFANDYRVIEENCKCVACSSGISRAYLHGLMAAKETVGCHLISLHNLQFQLDLMKDMREAIKSNTFPSFVETFLINLYECIENIPQWVVEALSSVNIQMSQNK